MSRRLILLCATVLEHLGYAITAVALLALLAGLNQALAQPVLATDPVPRVVFPVTHVGNVSTIGARTADAANAAKFSFGVAANGAVFANTGDRLPTPGGQSIPIGVNGTISKPNVAAALGRFARKAIPLLSTGAALYDLGEELGFGLDNSGGGLVVTKRDPDACAANCFSYAGLTGVTPAATPPYLPAAQAAQWYVGRTIPGGYGACSFSTVTGAAVTGSHPNIRFALTCGTSGVYSSPTNFQARAPDPVTYIPSNVQEFENAIASNSGWPTSSALARATVDAIKAGEALEVVPTTITGPATSPGPSSQTVNNTAGETTSSVSIHHHNYAGSQVTTTTVTTNTTTNISTGAVTNQSTVTTSPVITPTPGSEEAANDPTPFAMPCGVAGTPPCGVKVDESGTPEYDPDKFKLDPTLETKAQELRDKVSGEGDKTGLFTNMRNLFTLPAIRECEAIEMPSVMGMEVPEMNPCPGVEWLRGLMAWIWAVAGFLFCWSQVQAARS